jgi:hypothetical protein
MYIVDHALDLCVPEYFRLLRSHTVSNVGDLQTLWRNMLFLLAVKMEVDGVSKMSVSTSLRDTIRYTLIFISTAKGS